MAAKLGLIPPQNYQTILTRIGAILLEELTEQQVLDNTFDLPTIWAERFIPLDKTEVPAINVSLATGDYDNKDQTQVDGTYTFYIDCYTQSPELDSEYADTAASLKLQRLIGKVRAILESPFYRTLSIATPSIIRTKVTGFSIGKKQESMMIDALSNIIGRITFVVKCPEYVQLASTITLAGNTTVVSLFESDNGYKFILDI